MQRTALPNASTFLHLFRKAGRIQGNDGFAAGWPAVNDFPPVRQAARHVLFAARL